MLPATRPDGSLCDRRMSVVPLEQQEIELYGNRMLTKEANNNQILATENGALECETPIQEFYAGESVFITGGTGFLGKILIEKLLRSCPKLSTIYLLVRSKKGKSVQSRMEELFQEPVYDRLKKESPKFRDKIVPVNGDCALNYLGLSESDRNMLIKEVSIVFHVAATVRFDENLRLALAINAQSTTDILDMCKKMKKLKAFVHVSTAYANCHVNHIEEKFYDYPINYDSVYTLVNSLPNDALNEMTQRILGQWPNTYTFTKAAAEATIKEKNGGLPIGIFRPAIVISTAYEPLIGWIDNLYGPTGIVAGATTGVLRVMNGDPDVNANIVPVDLTVNALIASAWDVFTQTEKRNENMLIYNFVSSVEAPLTWRTYSAINMKYADQYPLSSRMWHLSFSIIKNKVLYTICMLFSHLLPAALVDSAKICTGHKPNLWRAYEKLHKFTRVIAHFCSNEWTYDNSNVQAMWLRLHPKDQQLFRFSMRDFDWAKYFTNYMKGIRIYLFNDDLSTLEKSKAKNRRFYWLHQTLKTFTLFTGFWILWKTFLTITTRI